MKWQVAGIDLCLHSSPLDSALCRNSLGCKRLAKLHLHPPLCPTHAPLPPPLTLHNFQVNTTQERGHRTTSLQQYKPSLCQRASPTREILYVSSYKIDWVSLVFSLSCGTEVRAGYHIRVSALARLSLSDLLTSRGESRERSEARFWVRVVSSR